MKKGIILFNAALIAEASMEHLCNNNVVVVTVNKDTQRKRLYRRKLTNEQIEKRLQSQYSADKKIKQLQQKIDTDCQGKLWVVDNSKETGGTADFKKLFREIINYLDLHGELRMKALFTRLGIEKSFALAYKTLYKAYAARKRYQHTLARVLTCITELDQIWHKLSNRDMVECAFWYNYIVYDTTRQDYIEQSAQFAHNVFTTAGLPADFCNKVAYYIRCTSHTQSNLQDDAVYIADIDLLPLASIPAEFTEYEENLRKEYYWMDTPHYYQNRREFYRALQERPRIYLSEYYYSRYEKRARENLTVFLSSEQ